MTGKIGFVLLLAQMLISINRYSAVESARILCIFPSPGRSHVLVGQALLKGLAERGHEVSRAFRYLNRYDSYQLHTHILGNNGEPIQAAETG